MIRSFKIHTLYREIPGKRVIMVCIGNSSWSYWSSLMRLQGRKFRSSRFTGGNETIACNVNRPVFFRFFSGDDISQWGIISRGQDRLKQTRGAHLKFLLVTSSFRVPRRHRNKLFARGLSRSSRVFIDYHRLCMGTLRPRRKSFVGVHAPLVTISKIRCCETSFEAVYLFKR